MTPSPELKKILSSWCKMQEEKYGPDWKSILAKELSDKLRADFDTYKKTRLLVEEKK